MEASVDAGNHAALVQALDSLRELLDRYAVDGATVASSVIPAVPTLDVVAASFGLSGFERAVLLLAAGVELDVRFGPVCAAAQGDPGRLNPTWSLALAVLPEAHWSALSPDGPLRRWRFIQVEGSGPLTTRPLRIAERVLHYLTGVACAEERLAGLFEPAEPVGALVPSQDAVALRIVDAWSPTRDVAPVIALGGADDETRRVIAAAAAGQVGLSLAATGLDLLPTAADELLEFCRLWEREAALSGAALYIDASIVDSGDPALHRVLQRVVSQLHGPVIVSALEPRLTFQRPILYLEVAKPTAAEQAQLWRDSLGDRAAELDGSLGALAAQFDLSAPAIGAAVDEALATGSPALAAELWSAGRVHARSRLRDLADRIETVATWDQLVLPADSMELLRTLADQLRYRATVYQQWGFGGAGSRGLGISTLFTGPSGTGKTMAADVLANELQLDLYRIDLAGVVSKYIGETEKNLRRVFDAAEEGGAALFFDEADALFGRRSEVKDSHDRYANIEVNYLLQRMESYRGVAILATNLKGSLDPAFLRRIRFVVSFPIPSVESRLRMWRQVFPAATPTEGLAPERLAQLSVTGGNIRSIAVNAAFLAAADGGVVRMQHLLQATRTEFAKLERPLPDSEVRGWV